MLPITTGDWKHSYDTSRYATRYFTSELFIDVSGCPFGRPSDL